ncbi:MAG: phytoene desaturase family protein [Roseibium sp.]|uniref:1-hydroxycarotenoid 3,4-desaturase CrtD n=1 Tax=Roseibium sp. TaxID=1936156 RepID=UPI003D9C30B0
MPETRVVIIGAGMGGLAAALRLANSDVSVIVLEAGAAPGGKMRQVQAGGKAAFDAGPTVLTMKWVFDDLLSGLNTSLEDEVKLDRADLLARHYWAGAAALDLYADVEKSAGAIGAFSGRQDAAGYREFAADSKRIFETLKDTFISASRPSPVTLSRRIGFNRFADMLALRPFSTLWTALGGYFTDPRLRQLFGRYATYCGSSPFAAPATLMLVAHVEQAGVWIPKDGMHAIATRFQALAESYGVVFRFGARADQIETDRSDRKVTAVRLSSGEVIEADRVIFNGDVSALQDLLTPARGKGYKRVPAAKRSQSALVSCGLAATKGVPLTHHTVFFSDDYDAEFQAVFRDRAAPADPTVYVCAQDRNSSGGPRSPGAATGRERIYCLMNLPADGDTHSYSTSELEQCLTAIDRRLARNGLTLHRDRQAQDLTAPDGFNKLFPATGGALYGQASHGWMASFSRLGATGNLSGLYLAGGSVHPGPGIPMAALSGKLAAEQALTDAAMTSRFPRAAISGGISTRPATAARTPSR